MKLLGEDEPRAMLALFASIPLSADSTIERLDRELNLPTLHTDNLYRCRTPKYEYLVNMEGQTRYKRAALNRQFDYVHAIVAKYRCPCRSFLVLLTEEGVPRVLPSVLYRKNRYHSASLRLRFVCLRRLAAARILRMKSAQLLSWAPTLDSSSAALRKADFAMVVKKRFCRG